MKHNIKAVQFVKLEGEVNKAAAVSDIIGKALKIIHLHDDETGEYYVAIAIVDNFPEGIEGNVVTDIDLMNELNDSIINNHEIM
jgi:hypothetical protein